MKTMRNTTPMPEHLIICSDGALHDKRKPDWAVMPLRENYRFQFRAINTLAQVKATLRAGNVTWPGGYPLHFITQNGAALCFDCAKKEFRQVVWDFMNKASTGWRIVACEADWEDNDLTCDHRSKKIPSAYGEDEEDEE